TASLRTDHAPVTLQFQWLSGKTYVQTMTMDADMTMPMGGQEMTQSTRMEMTMSMAVSGVDGGGKRIDVHYDHIAMTVSAMGNEMHYDSADPAQSTGPLASMGDVTKRDFHVVMNDRNEIVSVDWDGEVAAEVQQMMDQFASKEQMGQLMSTWLTQWLPGKPVNPGDSWPLELSWQIPTLGGIELAGTSTLAGFTERDGHDCAVLDIALEMDADFSGSGGDGEQAEALRQLGMKIDGGTTTLRCYWDNDLGWMRGLDMDQRFSVSMKNPQDGTPVEMPLHQKMECTVEVK
ncbi:MAG: hypothetical protein KC729_19850, partial [Candidatus Eisenbacteria bacterium]|nr:hypothetical protein [Candidatus Eisenbacteria bacterium]